MIDLSDLTELSYIFTEFYSINWSFDWYLSD